MHLKSLRIRNLRAIEDIAVEFDSRVSVIVGPNAIGKTTVLEAVRLLKALLSPRTQSESVQALIALGAVSPHLPQQLSISALARSPSAPVVITARFQLTSGEIGWLENSLQLVCRNLIQARMGQAFGNPTTLINFLGTPQGVELLATTKKEVADTIDALKADDKQCRVELKVSTENGIEATDGGAWPALIGMLDQRHPPGLTSFSYFPADRALPQGEQPIQLGAADAQAQLETHFSQPQSKYTRLKNTIFNTMLVSEDGRARLEEDFRRIFSGILKGRQLVGFGLNHVGLLSIIVRDTETGRQFEIDGMSSGEKGLILTFLLIEQSVAEDGLILLDEPELHLNPAVCKDLISFLVSEYAARKNLQVLICSHSPEILAGAFDNDECSLFHLESERMITKVRRQDHAVIAETLRRLGTSESEGLLYRGTVFVEGPDDVALLEAGFLGLLRRYKIKDLGGRREVEKEIRQLQAAEDRGVELTPRYFIFDRDEMPTGLTSSSCVKVLQWERRCLENYLIDSDLLADLLMSTDVVCKPLQSIGEVERLLQTLALAQIDDLVAKQVFQEYGYEDPGIRIAEIRGKPLSDISTIMANRLCTIRDQVSGFDVEGWKRDYLARCSNEKDRVATAWERSWMKDCDGKRLFGDLCQAIQPRHGPRKFKVRVMTEMRLRPSNGWQQMNRLISSILPT